ncbi:MAG: BatA domain-containing protein [Planctomycetales bacterium]|nr:BatA domain-containing protein [Planctomycetales bacterium]
MTFVNGSLLALGGLLVVVPVLLHLLMKRKPSHQVFPAMRFLVKRHSVNTRKMRLRHWLLLALRCAAIVLLAAALARPSVASGAIGNWLVVGLLGILLAVVIVVLLLAVTQQKGRWLVGGLGLLAVLLGVSEAYSVTKALQQGGSVLLGDKEQPVAAAIVIDTAARMQYQHENETRLQKAQRMASWLIRQLPKDSEVAVLDSRRIGGGFSIDLGAAVTAVEGMQASYGSLPLTEICQQAMSLLNESQMSRKELYVFTDLTEPAWPTEASESLQRQLTESADTLFYLIDVGVPEAANRCIANVQLSSEVLSNNSLLTVQAEFVNQRSDSSTPVRLVMIEPADQPPVRLDGVLQQPNSTVRARDTLDVADGGSQWTSFKVAGLTTGTHHGFVEIENPDNLAFDNRRYFTVDVRPPAPILLVGKDAGDTRDLSDALAPPLLQQQGQARYEVTSISQAELPSHPLNKYSVVCLVDPAPLVDADWISLHRFVASGGGLAIFAGRNASPVDQFNSDEALNVLPTALKRTWRIPEGTELAPTNFDHPILNPFREIATSVPWDLLPVFRHWSLDALSGDSRIIFAFGNGQPALVERVVGDGRVVLMTTPVSDAGLDKPWNYLINNEEPWPMVILADRIMLYLSQSEAGRLNYEVGQPVRLSVGDKATSKRFQLFTPRGDWQEVNSVQGAVQFGFTDLPGTYQLFEDAGSGSKGFSVNVPGEGSNLNRLAPEQLATILGEDRFQVARDQQEIVRGVDQARIGREFYPFLTVTLAVILAIEQLLANRFYSQKQTAPATVRSISS